jgi:hypothetical protein
MSTQSSVPLPVNLTYLKQIAELVTALFQLVHYMNMYYMKTLQCIYRRNIELSMS